jgi:hypothetical protein
MLKQESRQTFEVSLAFAVPAGGFGHVFASNSRSASQKDIACIEALALPVDLGRRMQRGVGWDLFLRGIG